MQERQGEQKEKQMNFEESILITHIKMVHGFSLEEVTRGAENNIAASQFEVAKAILKRPNKVVVHEGLSRLFTSNQCHPETIKMIQTHFNSQVFDCEFNQLNSQQIKLLLKFSGAFILVYLGLLPKIYPSISQENKTNIERELLACGNNVAEIIQLEKRSRQTREMDAIFYCKKAAYLENSNEVILAYGLNHDFNDCARFDNSIKLQEIDASGIHVEPELIDQRAYDEAYQLVMKRLGSG